MSTSDGHPALEIELKLAFPPEARDRIEAHAVFHGPRAAGPRSGHQVTTYFDTPDLALAREGLSLRVRAKDGRRIQTLKSETAANGAAATRGEWEWAVRSGRPDASLLLGTPAAAHAADRLEPVLITDINRTTRMLTLGDTEIEAAFDEGFIRTGGKELPVHELELELKAGPPGPLYQLALTLHADLPLRLEPEAKSTRGYRLHTGRPPAMHKTTKPDLAPDVSAADGFRQILGAGLGSLIGNQPAAISGDPEGVHQMRIAVRRLRTALVLFKPHLEPHTTVRFGEQLRRLGQVLGEARDWDVFTLDTLPAALDAGPMHDLLAPAAQARRQAAGNAMREELARPNLTGLVLALAAWAEDETLMLDAAARTARLVDLAPGLLDRLARKVTRRGKHISRLSPPELHKVRKSLKKLRYAVDDVAPLFSAKRVKSFRKRCTGMQDELGSINDATMAVTLVEMLASDSQPDRIPAIAAAAQWGDKRRQKAMRKLPDRWAEFRDAAPFWR